MIRKPLSARELLCNPLSGRRPSTVATSRKGRLAADLIQPSKGPGRAASGFPETRPETAGPVDGAVIGEILDQSTVGLLILNAGFKVVWLNRTLARYTGLSRNSLIGRDYRQVIDREFGVIFDDCGPLLRGLSAVRTGDGGTEAVECHVLPGATRSERWLNHCSQVIQAGVFDGGRIEHFTDISSRKQKRDAERLLRAQLQRDQKMEAIGILAGGVAHDFNNLLQTISGYTQLLLINTPAGHPEGDMLAAIDKAAVRAGALTQQLLAFSRRLESRLQPTNLNTLVELVKRMLDRTLPQAIHTHLALEENLPEVSIDDAQIEQVLMHLALNARQAMPGGGQLTFATRRLRVDHGDHEAPLGLPGGEYVHLAVTDTGRGMDDKTRQHIFEPFYTTRRVGEGSGLGLSMVYGILKNHGAGIECISEAGHGTQFSIYFPVPAAGCRKNDRDNLRGKGETVLIVDDDPVLLTLNTNVLRLHGYRVLTAESGEAALELCGAGAVIDLVVLDLTMPGMGGEKCLAEMTRRRPDIKVIVTSGYPPDESLRESLAAAGREFIAKPYPLNGLLVAMRAAFNRRPPAAGQVPAMVTPLR